MKHIFLFLSILFLAPLTKAQIVNIPDATLKQYFLNDWNGPDANDDGEIQVSEAENWGGSINLNYSLNPVADFTGLDSFTKLSGISLFGAYQAPLPNLSIFENLQGLSIIGTNYTSLNIDDVPILKTIEIRNNSLLEGITIDNLPEVWKIEIINNDTLSGTYDFQGAATSALRQLYFDDNGLVTGISVKNISSLEWFRCNSNAQITSIEISDLPLLDRAWVEKNNAIANLNISEFPRLKSLNINNNTNLTALTFSNLPILSSLGCSSNNLATIDVSMLDALESLNLYNNKLSQLDTSNLEYLKYVHCHNNQLSSLTFHNNPLLYEIQAGNNQLSTIDLSNVNWTKAFFSNNLLETAFIKNGRVIGQIGFSDNPSLKYICANDNDIESLSNKYPNAEVNGYCSFQPGGNYETITGLVQLDADKDGCGDGADNYPFPNHKMYVSYPDNSTRTIYTDSEGAYTAYVPGDALYTVSPDFDAGDFTSTPSSHLASFPLQTSPVIADFCITAKTPYTDVSTVVVNKSGEIRPGFPVIFDIIITNNGSTVSTGLLHFFYDENQLDYVSSDPSGNTATANSIRWSYVSLVPFETRKYEVVFNAKRPTDPQNPLNNGDVVEYRAKIVANQPDSNLHDNEHTAREIVVNSFDPNDIMCIEGTKLLLEKIGGKVHYRIRFENLGTASAVNIVVKNYIDPTMFDLSTLKPIAASHDFVTRIDGNNVEFIFENIQLPFDDANNDGYLIYQIENLGNHVEGSTIENEAAIYFDYNAPVETNREISTFVSTLSIDTDYFASLNVYPNPANGQLFFTQPDQIQEARIFDLTGKQHTAGKPTNGTLNISHLVAGIYMLQLETTVGKKVQKIIKQ